MNYPLCAFVTGIGVGFAKGYGAPVAGMDAMVVGTPLAFGALRGFAEIRAFQRGSLFDVSRRPDGGPRAFDGVAIVGIDALVGEFVGLGVGYLCR